MDQDQYLQALRPAVHKDLSGMKADYPVIKYLPKLFRAL